MTYSYKTHGTCSRRIDFDIDDDNTVHNVHFTGGCNGNLAGISSIVEGMDAEEIIDRFDGIRCGFSLALSGMNRPEAVWVSASACLTMILSSNGVSEIDTVDLLFLKRNRYLPRRDPLARG